MTDYDIRLATLETDRAAAYRLRYELYVEAQGLFEDVADRERRWLRDDMDEKAVIFVAEANGEIVGTGRMVPGGIGCLDRETRETFDIEAFAGVVEERELGVASRLLVRPEHRGGPLTVTLIARMWALAIERGFEVLLGECEPHLVNTWIRLGFRPYGLCEHPINGTLVRIAFVLGDYAHAKKLGSPLVPALSQYKKDDSIPQRLRELLLHCQQVVSEADARTRYWATVEQTVARAELAQRLGGLSDDELEAVLDKGHALDCDPGAMLIRKGHVSRTLYVLLTGSLVIRDEGTTIVEISEPGEFFGEVAFFTDGERMSDVLAGERGARVLALSVRSLKSLVDMQGSGAAKFLLTMTRGLCHKLRQRSLRPSEALTLLGLEPVESEPETP